MHHDLIKWYWEEHRTLQESRPRIIEPLLREKESAIAKLHEELSHAERCLVLQREQQLATDQGIPLNVPEAGDWEVTLDQINNRMRKLRRERAEIRERLDANPGSNYVMNDRGFCQCATEDAIDHSSDPDRMRAFLMIAVLVDQMMWTHFLSLYGKLQESGFVFPKLFWHPTFPQNMGKPDWFAYSHHGYDKKVNWKVTEEVAEILLTGLYSWFDQIGRGEKKRGFQQILEHTIEETYEPVNSDRLIPIVSKLVGQGDDCESRFFRLFLIRKNRERLWALESRLSKLEVPLKAKQNRNLLKKQRADAHLLRNTFRTNLIQELAGLTIIEQLHRVADDKDHVVQFYPTRIASRATTEVIKQLDKATRDKLIGRMRGRHKGPWMKFKYRLASVCFEERYPGGHPVMYHRVRLCDLDSPADRLTMFRYKSQREN